MGGQEIAARLPRELRKEVVRPDRDDHLAERRGRSIELLEESREHVAD